MAEVCELCISAGEESGLGERLTCIHPRIHCVATPENIETKDELENIAINNFLDTLADVALAIIRRRGQLDS